MNGIVPIFSSMPVNVYFIMSLSKALSFHSVLLTDSLDQKFTGPGGDGLALHNDVFGLGGQNSRLGVG